MQVSHNPPIGRMEPLKTKRYPLGTKVVPFGAQYRQHKVHGAEGHDPRGRHTKGARDVQDPYRTRHGRFRCSLRTAGRTSCHRANHGR